MSFDTALPSYRLSIDADELRPALLAAGTQIMISFVWALLLASGAPA